MQEKLTGRIADNDMILPQRCAHICANICKCIVGFERKQSRLICVYSIFVRLFVFIYSHFVHIDESIIQLTIEKMNLIKTKTEINRDLLLLQFCWEIRFTSGVLVYAILCENVKNETNSIIDIII